jgi:hypothetical protein
MKPLRAADAADLIERFLDGTERYPQEWNDFIEAMPVEGDVEQYRRSCYVLDPLVNKPGEPDAEALSELKEIVARLRAM